jgi:hypothetical protein
MGLERLLKNARTLSMGKSLNGQPGPVKGFYRSFKGIFN